MSAYALALLRDNVPDKSYPAKLQQKMAERFSRLEYDENYQGVFCKQKVREPESNSTRKEVYESESHFRT